MLFSSIPNKQKNLGLEGPEWISPALLSPRTLSTSSPSPAMWITGLPLFPKCLPLGKAQNSSRKTELSLSTGADLFYPAGKAAFFFFNGRVYWHKSCAWNWVTGKSTNHNLWHGVMTWTIMLQGLQSLWRSEMRLEKWEVQAYRVWWKGIAIQLNGSTPQVGFRWGSICLILRTMIPPYEDKVGFGTKGFICSRVALCRHVSLSLLLLSSQ